MIHLIDGNINLYKSDKPSYSASLEYAKNMQTILSDNPTPLLFHCFWRVPRSFGEKQMAVLKSIVHHHRGLDFEINLWSNIDLTESIREICELQETSGQMSSRIREDIQTHLRVKKWNYNEERKDTILESSGPDSFEDELCYLEGDLFRLLILHKYGGIYIDMDVLVLRDMSPLNHLEFLYQWGTSGTTENEPTMKMNGAIMRLNARSDLSLEYLELILETPPQKDTFCWGSDMYSNIRRNRVLCLPGVWFDSEWGFEATENNPFGEVDAVDMFGGAYAWHWHNRWDAIICNKSKFRALESSFF
jgi:hypothetical protein